MVEDYIITRTLKQRFPPGTIGHTMEYDAIATSQTKSFWEIISESEAAQIRLEAKKAYNPSRGRDGNLRTFKGGKIDPINRSNTKYDGKSNI